jgi:Bacterial SH3 domain
MKISHVSAAAIALVLGATVASAESVWVKAELVDIRSGKAAIYPKVTTVKKGDELTVKSRDGHWVEVQLANGSSGWINDVSLSSQKVGADLVGFAPGAAAAEMSTGVAARGLQPGAETYASSKGLSKAPLEALIALRKSIQPAEYESFINEGHVGAK